MTNLHPTAPFPSTRWSWILLAREAGTTAGRDALGELCRSYWYPVYGLIRRRGMSSSDAADLTQEYFARLIQGGLLRAVDRDKGRFRDFLRADCHFFLANQRDRARAKKRGGGASFFPIDAQGAEARLGLEPSGDMNPDRLFDRAWALSLIDRAFDRLAGDEARSGRSPAFERLRVFLVAGSHTPPHAEVAEDLGTTVAAVQSSVARLRRRYRALLRAEVAGTLAGPTEAEIDEEVRALFSALAR